VIDPIHELGLTRQAQLLQLSRESLYYEPVAASAADLPLMRRLDELHPAVVPLCADESCLHLGEFNQAARRYRFINIKLDKTGGLTHALELARAARARGLGLMVGCMAGGSLAMAPAFVVGCLADLVDIDGPLLQRSDRLPGLTYDGGQVSVFGPTLWG